MKNTEREGVSAVQSIVYSDLQWIFREQTVVDFGIDAQIEIANQESATGKVIAVQIKSGDSYFIRKTEENIIFCFDEKHKNYWVNHSLPVIILLYHPVSKECIWEVIDDYTVKQVSENRYKVGIPRENKFGVSSKAKLLILAYKEKIDDLAKEIDDLDVDKESVFDMLNDSQKKTFLNVRVIIDKKNASSEKGLFDYKKEEVSDVVSPMLDKMDNIFVGEHFLKSMCYIEAFICSTQSKTLIILGEAGIGKTTLVKMVIEKSKERNNILYIDTQKCRKDILNEIQSEYEINNRIRVIIIDGWDVLIPNERLNAWYNIMKWHYCHKEIKVIITSRYMENSIWENADIIRIHPLSQREVYTFLNSMTRDRFISDELAKKIVDFNTPLLLKMFVALTGQLDIPLEECTRDNILFSLISSQHSEEENWALENIAFRMMQDNKMIITLSDNKYLKYLSKFKELRIERGQVSFVHKMFYEIFAAKYAFRHIFKEEKDPKEFGAAVWDVFANNLCSINILNYIKFLIKNEKNDDIFLSQLNYNFGYMLECGMVFDFSNNMETFKAISNVFYTTWHIVSYVNRKYYKVFKPDISNISEVNLSCIINIFNKVYFNDTYLDFSHTDFSYMKLWRCNMTNMNFRESKLCHTNFLGSCFAGSDFQKADLSYSNLVATDLRCVNLKEAILTGANVGNCMISEDSLKYFLPYKDTLLHVEKLIVFMNDGTIKHFFDLF